jgi:ATP-binding cassette subfamily B protein
VLLRIIISHLRRRPWLATAALLFQVLQTIAAIMLPTLNADIINNGVAKADTGYILRTGGLMLLLTLVQGVCTVAAVYFGAKAAMLLGRDLRHELFGHANGFSERELSKFGAPSLITRNTNDVQQIQMLVLLMFTLLAAAPIMAVGGVIAAIRLDAALAWILAVSVPVLLVVMVFTVSRMVPQFKRMQTRIDAINRVMREQLSGIRVIRAFVREPEERARFTRANESLTDTSMVVGKLFATLFPIVMLVLNYSSVAVIWFGAQRVDSGATDVGTLIAFLSYLMQVLMSVMMATFMIIMIPRAQVCAERIQAVLSTETSVPVPATTESPARLHRVDFRDAGFQYPGAERPVLSGISLSVLPGTTTAVVGSTGSGKSTLVKLVPRLFDATHGAVLVDGTDVRRFEPEDLWARIGYVPQKAFLFSGTVATNLRFGAPEATDDDLWAALRVAQADGFVREMAGGLDAPIAQGGTNVSGGQRQRLAIARALVRRPGILIFDDSFSALDTATDARLRAELPAFTAQTATIVVAQRISSIRDADQIAVLDHGTVVGLGTNAQLLDGCEVYREIVSSQLGAREAA